MFFRDRHFPLYSTDCLVSSEMDDGGSESDLSDDEDVSLVAYF